MYIKLIVFHELSLGYSVNKKSNPLVTSCRGLTQAQTSEALRPFLFAVHPDFFGKYPKERVGDVTFTPLTCFFPDLSRGTSRGVLHTADSSLNASCDLQTYFLENTCLNNVISILFEGNLHQYGTLH